MNDSDAKDVLVQLVQPVIDTLQQCTRQLQDSLSLTSLKSYINHKELEQDNLNLSSRCSNMQQSWTSLRLANERLEQSLAESRSVARTLLSLVQLPWDDHRKACLIRDYKWLDTSPPEYRDF